jgi:hypothetical protein
VPHALPNWSLLGSRRRARAAHRGLAEGVGFAVAETTGVGHCGHWVETVYGEDDRATRVAIAGQVLAKHGNEIRGGSGACVVADQLWHKLCATSTRTRTCERPWP